MHGGADKITEKYLRAKTHIFPSFHMSNFQAVPNGLGKTVRAWSDPFSPMVPAWHFVSERRISAAALRRLLSMFWAPWRPPAFMGLVEEKNIC